jgi:phosphonoacetate hydrolase
MPALKAMAHEGIATEVQAVFPTVTNVNNVSICCGAWPAEHGISANSYYDPSSGAAVYMNAAALVRTPTLFERAAAAGVASALLTCKRKTVELLHRGASLAIAAEAPTPEVVARYGPPGDIYSAGINHWLWTVALDLLRTRPDLGVLYVHTTDYPMHRWGPEAPESQDHLARLDSLLGEARAAAPDAALLFTADHGMHAKKRCWDLARVCEKGGIPLRFALSPERDYYVAHHRNFTGCAWLWLRSPGDERRVREIVGALAGVEGVLDRAEAAARFRQPAERIGDLTVLGDVDTMFGELDGTGEELTAYRAHGSLHESAVPLVIHGAERAPPREAFRANLDLARWVFGAR